MADNRTDEDWARDAVRAMLFKVLMNLAIEFERAAQEAVR